MYEPSRHVSTFYVAGFQLNEGKYGEQYLAPKYLAEELIKELGRSGTAVPTPRPHDGGAA